MPHAMHERSVKGLGLVTRWSTGPRLAAVSLCLGSGLVLGACSVPVADLPVIGLPSGSPTRPADPTPYPAVHDMPASRQDPVLDPAEQAKLSSDLKAVRDRQEGATKASDKADH